MLDLPVDTASSASAFTGAGDGRGAKSIPIAAAAAKDRPICRRTQPAGDAVRTTVRLVRRYV